MLHIFLTKKIMFTRKYIEEIIESCNFRNESKRFLYITSDRDEKRREGERSLIRHGMLILLNSNSH